VARQSIRPHLVIGLMSGTSCDGVDAALVRVCGCGLRTRVELAAFITVPYPAAVRRVVARASSPGEGRVDLVCQANVLVGELFAEAALEVARRGGVAMRRVDLIGSHGQTIQHLPSPVRVAGRRVASTLQIGEPSVIAERTGVTTVADFRPRDMACGGQGAPLVPYVDYLLLRHRTRARVALNIGGIANATWLPPLCRPDQVVAFDTGPGNMVLDALARHASGGRRRCDRDGAMAARGTVCEPLLRRLLRHPFFRNAPPKSTGRETFGEAFVGGLLERAGDLSVADLLATATELTVRSIAGALERFVRPLGGIDEVIASGGGCHNATLMALLSAALSPTPVRRSDAFGLPADAKEAMAFAVLAHETLAGRAGNLPSATGARRAAILGKIIPGTRVPW